MRYYRKLSNYLKNIEKKFNERNSFVNQVNFWYLSSYLKIIWRSICLIVWFNCFGYKLSLIRIDEGDEWPFSGKWRGIRAWKKCIWKVTKLIYKVSCKKDQSHIKKLDLFKPITTITKNIPNLQHYQNLIKTNSINMTATILIWQITWSMTPTKIRANIRKANQWTFKSPTFLCMTL